MVANLHVSITLMLGCAMLVAVFGNPHKLHIQDWNKKRNLEKSLLDTISGTKEATKQTRQFCTPPSSLHQVNFPSRESQNKPLTQPANCGQKRNSKRSDNLRRMLADVLEPQYPDISEDLNKRIVGGQESKLGQWPWLVAVWQGGPACGATLITDKWIVTAAHCFEHPSSVCSDEFLVGEFNLMTDDETNHATHYAKDIIIHKDYDKDQTLNDIALIRIENPVEMTDKINVACLPHSTQEEVADPNKCFVAGWGATGFNKQGTNVINHVRIPLLAKGDCYEAYGTLDESRLCAGHLDGGKDSCQGDSGGPLTCERADGTSVLMGIVSYGDECAKAGAPGIYSNVRHFLPWIRGTIFEYEQGRK